MTSQADRYATPKTAAERLGITEGQVRLLAHYGRVKPVACLLTRGRPRLYVFAELAELHRDATNSASPLTHRPCPVRNGAADRPMPAPT